MAAITRFGLDGYGVRRAGSFAGKTSGSTHPVGVLTRLSLDGYGARRAGSFAGKTAEEGGADSGWLAAFIRRRENARRGRRGRR